MLATRAAKWLILRARKQTWVEPRGAGAIINVCGHARMGSVHWYAWWVGGWGGANAHLAVFTVAGGSEASDNQCDLRSVAGVRDHANGMPRTAVEWLVSLRLHYDSAPGAISGTKRSLSRTVR